MSPSESEKLDNHDKRLHNLELQAALDKQSRQNMHRSVDAINNSVANLAVDFKAFLEDYHQNKTDAALTAQTMGALAEKIKSLDECKAEKIEVSAIDKKITEVKDGQTWALRTALGALLGAVIAAWKSFRG